MTESLSSLQKRILIIDGSPLECAPLLRLMEQRGYFVSVVDNGPLALDMIRKEGFALVLLDISLQAGMSGLDVLCALRCDYSAIELPVLIIARADERQETLTALGAGASGVIARPFDLGMAQSWVEVQMRMCREYQTSLGDLQSIRGDQPSKRRSSNLFYCDCCLSCHQGVLTVCATCNQPMPPGGWPRIEGTSFTYLGQRIGSRYLLTQFIGHGSVGNVYRASDINLGRDFAVKIINFDDMPVEQRAAIRNQTLLEVEALVRLENPHVVKLYQVLHLVGETYALVMDFNRGKTLEQLLNDDGAFEPWLALEVVRQVSQALHEAHQNRILHRDVKPGNIMIEQLSTGEPFVRLLDFGIVQMISRPDEDDDLRGTPDYVSPEQIMGHPLDARTDIYALGATLYHMLTGYPPFSGETIQDLLAEQIYAPLEPLPEALGVELVRDAFNQLLEKMMSKDLNARCLDMDTLLVELESLKTTVEPYLT